MAGNKPTIKIIPENRIVTLENQNNITIKNIQDEIKQKNTLLNPSYTFSSFVVGSSNQYAYSAAKSIAQKPGKTYNPVFIYGPTGLGKTHLIHAIGNYAQTNGKLVIYTTIEQFMNDFTYSLKNGSMERFR